jgi:hypothetical protein
VDGRGLLPWSFAEERLVSSHDYWVATSEKSGQPHLMPVWGVWLEPELWFSSNLGSLKTRNIMNDGRCAVSTSDAENPVVVKGIAKVVRTRAAIARFLKASNQKYGVDYGIDFLDPDVNATFRLKPRWVFALTESDFTSSPTRWVFD